MRISADRVLPLVLGTVPVAIVIGLACFILLVQQPTALVKQPAAGASTPTTTPGSQIPGQLLIPPGQTTSSPPPAQGTNPPPANQGGFCIPLIGCV